MSVNGADRYGDFHDGSQKTPDRIGGSTLYYRDKKEKEEGTNGTE